MRTHMRATAAGFVVVLAVATAPAIPAAGIPGDRNAVEHALNRLTFGPRPGDVERVQKMGLSAWIEEQLTPSRIDDSALAPHLPAIPPKPTTVNSPQEARRHGREAVQALAAQKVMRAVYSERQLEEVLVDFWFNHFNVAATDRRDYDISPYERIAIRPADPRLSLAMLTVEGERVTSVRLDVANEGARVRDSLALALPWTLLLDGVRSATGISLAFRTDGDVAWVRLPEGVAPLASGAVSVSMHAPAGTSAPPVVAVTVEGAHLLDDWLPRVEAPADSAGAPRASWRPGCTLHFDLPPEFTAIAAGRLAADFVSEGRRRTTWSAGRGSAPAPLFVIGRFRRGAVRQGTLVTLRTWIAPADSSVAPSRADTIADVAMEAWRFFTWAFGRLAVDDAYLLVADLGRQGTAGATLLVPAEAPDDSVRTAVARVWWGSAVRFVGAGAQWLADALPAWSVLLYHESTDRDSTRWQAFRMEAEANGRVAALEAIRRTLGESAFRAALRRFFLDHRFVPATQADLNALFEQAPH